MNSQDLLLLWSDSASVSTLMWFVVVVLMLYLGRQAAHKLIVSLCRSVYVSLRLASRSTGQLEARLSARNKEVTLTMGKENLERTIEREFERVKAVVERDLSEYPALHRKISDEITAISDAYRASAEPAQLPPTWLAAVNTIEGIPRNGDTTMTRILDNIQDTIKEAHGETIKAYTQSSQTRHKLLKEMQPGWRQLDQDLVQVKSSVDSLGERAATIDEHMQNYEQIRRGEEAAERRLTSSSLAQFFIAGLVLVIAALGGVINFQMIALPMSEMVGGNSELGGMRTADVAALVIIMVEIAMGLFLMEALRITHLFPVIGSMDDKLRKRMAIITFTILFILASVESSLAYMRDLLALDREAITQSLSGIGVVEAQFRWIPSLGQMVMGFILPFALAFVAIPLESFIHAARTVIGLAAAMLLRMMVFVLRFVGHAVLQLGKVLVNAYDMVILLPLGIEQMVMKYKQGQPQTNIKLAQQIEPDLPLLNKKEVQS